jgi:hypothetical protein
LCSWASFRRPEGRQKSPTGTTSAQGHVAFFADKFDGTEGIFAELTGGASPISVISVGDGLFGSTITSVDLGRFALSDSDELAFLFVLEDGRSGVAIADLAAPEPGSLALRLSALGMMLLWKMPVGVAVCRQKASSITSRS